MTMAKRAAAAAASRSLYEERDERLISSKDRNQTNRRRSRFLKPCVPNSTKAVKPSNNTPLMSDVFPVGLEQWPSQVLFPGFKKPQKKWAEWIDRLAGKYCTIWNQAGICDAIMSSKYELKFNKDVVLTLAEFWSSETNTFGFDWGEATVTMEDVMILGGFSVLGRAVTKPVNGSSLDAAEEMERKKTELVRTRAKKACHSNWITHFMGLKDYKHEHVAFLSLWLARFVFPSLPEESLGKNVFPIAVLLSQGTRVALAPAVLAGLYRDMSVLRSQGLMGVEKITVSSPFQLLQLWALERLKQTVLKSFPKVLKPGEPRAARWHLVSTKISVDHLRRDVNLGENFCWRPYAVDLSNWQHGSYYHKENSCFFDKTTDLNLQSYVKCLCGCELVGIDDCKEKYLPHRVAMQFGIDQDLPGDPAESSGLGRGSGASNVGLFVPAWFFEPSVTARYAYWWREYRSARGDAIKDDVMVAIKRIKDKSLCAPMMEEKSLKMCKASTKPFTKTEFEYDMFSAVPEVPRKSNLTQKTRPSATAKKVNKVSSQSGNPDENVKKRKLAMPTEQLPAKKRNGKNTVNVQNNVPSRMVLENQKRANVSDKALLSSGKKVTAKGPLKNPVKVDCFKVEQSKNGAVREAKRTEGIARTKTQTDGLLKKVEELKNVILGMDL